MKNWWVSVSLGTMLVLAACGDASVASSDQVATSVAIEEEEEIEEIEVEETAPPLLSTTEPPPGVVAQVLCPANASCAEEFILNGSIYFTSCRGVLEEAVLLDEVLGAGEVNSLDVEVLAIEGHPLDDVVAVTLPSGCTEDPAEQISPWSFAAVEGSDFVSAVCEFGLLSLEQRQVDGCDN